MTRRELLRVSFLSAAGAALGPRGARGQGASQPPAGDRLYDPSIVRGRAAATAADNDGVIRALEHRLKCTCGCNLDIYTCRTTDFTCTYSPALHREVLALRQKGDSPEQVVEAFVAKYGEQILMAPKPQGFNLAGYLVPGSLVLLAGALLVAVLVRRGRHPRAASRTSSDFPSAPNPADAQRLQRALAEVED